MSDKLNLSTINSSEDENNKSSKIPVKNNRSKDTQQHKIIYIKPKFKTNNIEPLFETLSLKNQDNNKENFMLEQINFNKANNININFNVLKLNTRLNNCESEIRFNHLDKSKNIFLKHFIIS